MNGEVKINLIYQYTTIFACMETISLGCRKNRVVLLFQISYNKIILFKQLQPPQPPAAAPQPQSPRLQALCQPQSRPLRAPRQPQPPRPQALCQLQPRPLRGPRQPQPSRLQAFCQPQHHIRLNLL
ncbi:hypothetical protein KIN20_024953 [Parelaphostrongylus tenuis]|uniref:Uncharacterized protein n=1 Tax=Parelaphostrongylus tenuis TaxID=148309 RepID=A0AAD5MYW8_PARTN|nr:hypothetical protein KIN20_024953 [Parelaphostrongylus tenuis]